MPQRIVNQRLHRLGFAVRSQPPGLPGSPSRGYWICKHCRLRIAEPATTLPLCLECDELDKVNQELLMKSGSQSRRWLTVSIAACMFFLALVTVLSFLN